MVFTENYSIVFLIVFFGLSVFFSFITNWLLLRLSFNLGVRPNKENPTQIRWADNIKPSVGGFSFFIVFLISISVIGALPRESNLFLDKKLIGIMAASCLGFLLGLADDAYNTNPLVKFIGQLSCAFILILSDVYIKAFGVLSLDFAITTVWVIGMMNSINMLDNMDGITASISASILTSLILVVILTNNHFKNFYLVMMVGVTGSLIGFLFYNWKPAKIYMGDTGSQFLGVFLAACGILYFWSFNEKNSSHVIDIKQFVLPALGFIVPLIDTTTVTIRRLLRKQSPFVGGKDHITHHLVYFGMKEKNVALLLILVSLISSNIISFLVLFPNLWSMKVTLMLLIYCVVLFLGFQYLYNLGELKKPIEKK